MAAIPCTETQFRSYTESVFAEQLRETVNDKRGDRSTARARQVEDLPAWECHAHKFNGRAKDSTEAARQRLESLYWGKGAQMSTRAHELALSTTRA